MTSPISRRTFLGGATGMAAIAALTACTASTSTATRIFPTDPLVAKTEARRNFTGKTVTAVLTAGPVLASIAGRQIATWGFNDSLTAPVLRLSAGDELDATLTNHLTDNTSIHWHGVALRNVADGVPGLTQQGVNAGAIKSYRFRTTAPGTYWYHSHVEMQRERALYGALIIDDPKEALAYDQEWVILLDDWVDGFNGTPDSILKDLSQGMSMSGMKGMNMGTSNLLVNSTSAYLGGDAGDVKVPVHLINGSSNSNPASLSSKIGNRIRLRIINAAGDTAYRIGVPGQQLTVTHTDGYAVRPQSVDAVVLGMGERIDAFLTVKDTMTPLLALPEGKDGNVYAIVSTISGQVTRTAPPTQLGPIVTDGGRLKAADSVLLSSRGADRVFDLRLTGSMAKYSWGINGRKFNMSDPFAGAFEVRANERIRVNFTNETTMWHPMHVHGHTFQISNRGARKDTVMVRPKERVTIEFDADNPGQWLTHCHNAYHAARGMMGVFSYIK
jgi:FtsP/CotA-like multicopper oxidase with cupredoxin domain